MSVLSFLRTRKNTIKWNCSFLTIKLSTLLTIGIVFYLWTVLLLERKHAQLSSLIDVNCVSPFPFTTQMSIILDFYLTWIVELLVIFRQYVIALDLEMLLRDSLVFILVPKSNEVQIELSQIELPGNHYGRNCMQLFGNCINLDKPSKIHQTSIVLNLRSASPIFQKLKTLWLTLMLQFLLSNIIENIPSFFKDPALFFIFLQIHNYENPLLSHVLQISPLNLS